MKAQSPIPKILPPKSPKASKRPQSPKEKKVSIPVPVVLPAFHTLTEEPSQETLLSLNAQSVVGLTLRMKVMRGLTFLKSFPNLKWLDACDCQLTDELLLQFPQLANLEVLLLNDNQLKSTYPLVDFALMMPELLVVSFTNNKELLTDQTSLSNLKNIFKQCLIILESTPENRMLLALKKECLQLKNFASTSERTIGRLRQQLFELDHRRSIDLVKYLESLKQYLPNTSDLVHAFFASAKRFADQDPLVRSNHPRIPWVLLQEWPQKNFLKDYPQLQSSEVLTLFTEKEPHRLMESRQLDALLQKLLDDYFVLELQSLLKKATLQPSWQNVSKLVEFILETAVPFMRRYEEKYQLYADITYGDSIRIDMIMLLFRNPELLGRLDPLLNDPNSDKTKQSAQIKEFMRQLKLLKVRKLMDRTRKYSVRSVPFSEMNLEFFNEMYCAIDASHKDVFNLKLVDRTELFSEALLRSFNCRDYMDFAEFTQSGVTISEEFFEKNMKEFKEIVGVYGWVQELENLNQHILEVQPEEKYQAARTFLKRLIGRPAFTIPLLRKYFPKFSFELGESLIDSPTRHSSVHQLLNCFPDGFDFLIESLLKGQSTDRMVKLQETCKRLRETNPQHMKFVQIAVGLVRKQDMFIHANPVLASIIDDKEKYPLLQYLLRTNPSDQLIDTVLLLTEESKLQATEKQYLLNCLRHTVNIDDRTINLVNRSESAFLHYVPKMLDKQLLVTHKRMLELLEFSFELYQLNLRSTTEPVEHLGQLSPTISTLDLDGYLKSLSGSVFFLEYLCKVLRTELYSAIFENQQNSLTFSILKYKKLRRLTLTQQFIPTETREILDMISGNSLKEFIEIKHKVSVIDKADIVGAVVEASIRCQDFDDKFYTQNLREAYHASIIKDCLKKGLSNLAEYSERLNRVEDTFMKKTLTRSRIPLTEICSIVKTPQFKKSQLRNELVRFFKSRVRTEEMCQSISEQYQKVAAQIDAARHQDGQLLQLAGQIIEKQPLSVYRAFLSCLELFVSVHDRAKVYSYLDWQFFDSYYIHNHFCGWQQYFGQLEEQLDNHSRLFGKYLQRPTECHNEYDNIKRGCQKFKQLLYNFELDCIINEISDALELDFKSIRKFNYKMTANKLNVFFGLLKNRLPGQVEWLTGCHYQFCCAVRDRLGHHGFIQLKEYFLKGFITKPKIDQLLKIISYKVEFYESREQIASIHRSRAFNPANYFERLVQSLEILSKVNILNSQIEEKVVGGWSLLPWTFFDLYRELLGRKYWESLLSDFNKKSGIYLELVNYLQCQQQQATAGLDLLWKIFELFHSELSADDLIRRVRGLLKEVCPSSERLMSSLVDPLLNFDNFKVGQFGEPDIVQACSSIVSQLPFNNQQLLASLRVFSLRGEYLNRIEKINNKLRNVLSDYDQVCVDFADFEKRFKEPAMNDKLLRSLLKVLQISLTFKLHLFTALNKRNASDILALSLKNQFAGYCELDLKLELVETVNLESIISYQSDLLRDYLRDIPSGPFNIYSGKYQATEFYHIAFCTSIRDEEKYQIICRRNTAIKTLLDKKKDAIRAYRNYLAHYNSVGGINKESEDRYRIMSEQNRMEMLQQFDPIIRQVAKLWN